MLIQSNFDAGPEPARLVGLSRELGAAAAQQVRRTALLAQILR